MGLIGTVTDRHWHFGASCFDSAIIVLLYIEINGENGDDEKQSVLHCR